MCERHPVGRVVRARRPPRPRPIALAALAMTAGLTLGLQGYDKPLFVCAGLGVMLALATVLREERGPLVWAVLLFIGAAGVLTGLLAEQRARADCRTAWASGQRVQIVGVSLGFLPESERGSVRLRPRGSVKLIQLL